jgi:hypothetical protein
MARRPAPRRGASLILIGLMAVLTAVLLVVFVLRLATQPGAKVNLGSQEFDMGRASVFAPKVARFGPLQFPALRDGIDLLVQHLGTGPDKGWLAFETHPAEEARTCVLRWQPAAHHFSDPCSGRTFPEDGAGLRQYGVRVTNGDVIVNLRQPTGTTPQPSP